MALFIVLEGADICGKTTQVELLKQRFLQEGLPVYTTSFPRYNTRTGAAIKRYLHHELAFVNELDGVCTDESEYSSLIVQALQTMDKYEAATDIIEQLNGDTHVISSRWWQSAVIYGAESGLNHGLLLQTHKFLPQADLNVLINVPYDEAVKRRPDTKDRFETDRELQIRIRDEYMDTWNDHYSYQTSHTVAYHNGKGWLVVDGCQSPEEIHKAIWRGVMQVMQEYAHRQTGRR